MTTRLVSKNKNVTPPAVIRVWHEGKNDYRVQIDGVGDYCAVSQLGYAVQKLAYLESLSGEDFGHVVLAVLDAPSLAA